jgi:hypothetical protein
LAGGGLMPADEIRMIMELDAATMLVSERL